MKNVVVTGATGVIGTALIDKLKAEKIHVFLVCRPDSVGNSRVVEDELVTKVYCDISGLERLVFLVNTTCDAFFHLAWSGTDIPEYRVNLEIQKKNIEYSTKAVKVASQLGCKVFVGAGSQAEFGNVEGIIHPYMTPNPSSAYGTVKLCTKYITALMCRELGIRHIWPRILSVYGPHMKDNTLLGMVIKNVTNNKVPALTKCDQMWDYLYSSDAAEALYLLALYGKNEHEYVLGNGEANTLRYYAETVRDMINPVCELGFGLIPYRLDQVMHLEADISTITEDTGWIPSTQFKDGIKCVLSAIKK